MLALAAFVILCVIPLQAHEPHTCDHCGGSTLVDKKTRPGKPRQIPHDDCRAGLPRELGHHVEPTVTAGGTGYYVGGGASIFHHAHPRRRNEGTWGWDDTGHHSFRHRVVLGWFHGRKYQGGAGSYATDGPHIPDPIASTVTKLRNAHNPPEH